MTRPGFPHPEKCQKELKTMRKRNFIKSFLYYSAIIAIPILTVFLVFLAFVFQGKQNEIREDAETAAQAVRDNYSLVLDSAATQYDILARNPRLSISLRGFISHKQIGYLDVILTNTILSNFNSLTNNAPYIASVYYYLDGYDSILTSDTGGTTRLSQFSDLSWKDSYDHSDQDEWLERREMHQYSYTQPVPVLTYFKKLSMFKGVVMVNIYEEQLKQLINTSSQLDRFFILDKDGNFLLQGGAQTAQLSLEDKDLLVSRLEQSPDNAYRGWVDLSRGKYYVRIIPADCGTYIAACISHSNYYQALYTLLLQFLMVLAAVISTSLWIAYAITKKNFQQIDYFVEVFSDAERGVFNPEKPAFIKDEYDIILNNIVQLFLNQTFLRSQLALREQEQKVAEMTALQLQINPHFLFNTLQTLDFKAMEYTHKPTAVNQMIEALSDILKYSLQNPHSMVTLKDEIDYLKKVRRKNVRNVVLAAAGVFLFMAAALFMKLFVIGYPTESYVLTYTDVNGEQVNVGGVMSDSAAVYRGYKLVQEDGAQRLVIYSCLPSVWNRSGTFNLELALPGGGRDLNIQGITIKSNGDLISSLANELYRARNPYIGDASADGRLSGTLGISRELGSFKNELQTSGEPYGWTLNFEESTSNSAVFEDRMKAYACVLIALTDNLGQVSWNYTVELEQGPVLRHGTITEEECDEMVGAPVKTFADSPEGIEQLIKQLGIGR